MIIQRKTEETCLAVVYYMFEKFIRCYELFDSEAQGSSIISFDQPNQNSHSRSSILHVFQRLMHTILTRLFTAKLIDKSNGQNIGRAQRVINFYIHAGINGKSAGICAVNLPTIATSPGRCPNRTKKLVQIKELQKSSFCMSTWNALHGGKEMLLCV